MNQKNIPLITTQEASVEDDSSTLTTSDDGVSEVRNQASNKVIVQGVYGLLKDIKNSVDRLETQVQDCRTQLANVR